MTDPDQAAEFVDATACDSLAVAVGSIHAMTGREAELDVDRVRAIGRRVRVPLVLHGSSGVKHDSVLAAIACGVCKVNVATYLRQGFMAVLRAELLSCPDEVDFRKLFGPAREEAKERVREKIRLFGSNGRSNGHGGFRSPPTLHRSASAGRSRA
jgi:fructose-bisphosphate aldolase class II